jgi:hypothetical protein
MVDDSPLQGELCHVTFVLAEFPPCILGVGSNTCS